MIFACFFLSQNILVNSVGVAAASNDDVVAGADDDDDDNDAIDDVVQW